jgi:hypothetical protein
MQQHKHQTSATTQPQAVPAQTLWHTLGSRHVCVVVHVTYDAKAAPRLASSKRSVGISALPPLVMLPLPLLLLLLLLLSALGQQQAQFGYICLHLIQWYRVFK